LRNQRQAEIQRQLVIRRKVYGLITRVFCAECLPLSGGKPRLLYFGSFSWLRYNGRFCLPRKLNFNNEEIMKNQKGFTLIELLVVVLIIGILAAIALPQYQRALMKTRASDMMISGKAVAQAMQIYRLTNGKYTDDPDKLDIEMLGAVNSIVNSGLGRIELENFDISIRPSEAYFVVVRSTGGRKPQSIIYEILFNINGTVGCRFKESKGEELCLYLGGKNKTSYGAEFSQYTI
jgi:type IV pilus assembly protein PilE